MTVHVQMYKVSNEIANNFLFLSRGTFLSEIMAFAMTLSPKNS